MWFFIDLFVIAIIVLTVFIYAKRGFVRSLFGVIGFLVALVLAFMISTPISDFAYEKAIKPSVVSTLTESLVTNDGQINAATIKKIPKFISRGLNLDNIEVFDIDTPKTICERICDTNLKPRIMPFLKAVTSLILFVILSVVLKFVVNILNKLFSFSVIGKLNTVLGGTLGVIMGVIFAVVFVLVINLLITLFGKVAFFNTENINNTYIFKFILQQIIH